MAKRCSFAQKTNCTGINAGKSGIKNNYINRWVEG